MAIPEVDRLGARLEELWRDVDYTPTAFPELAVQTLSEASLAKELSPDRIVKWVFAGEELPHQVDPTAKFGQPPVTLFRGRRFYIDALFWTDGTTSIHQHAFSGAFQVLAGSSIETRFNFDVERNVDGHFAIGTLSVASTAFLRRGDTRPIESGARLIHSVFHLERPSVTIVVRTFSDAASGPQFDYSKSGIWPRSVLPGPRSRSRSPVGQHVAVGRIWGVRESGGRPCCAIGRPHGLSGASRMFQHI